MAGTSAARLRTWPTGNRVTRHGALRRRPGSQATVCDQAGLRDASSVDSFHRSDMTQIIINDVHDQFTLAYAIAAIQRAFAKDEAFWEPTAEFSNFDVHFEAADVAVVNGVRVRNLGQSVEVDKEAFDKVDLHGVDRREVHLEEEDRRFDDEDNLHGAPLMPCPRRGQHARLVDCWACWSDVRRGRAVEAEVLTDEAWLSRVLGTDS
jgi:hypothetical protein